MYRFFGSKSSSFIEDSSGSDSATVSLTAQRIDTSKVGVVTAGFCWEMSVAIPEDCELVHSMDRSMTALRKLARASWLPQKQFQLCL